MIPSATTGLPNGSRVTATGAATPSVAVGVGLLIACSNFGKRSSWFPFVLVAQISPVLLSTATDDGLLTAVIETVMGGFSPASGTLGNTAIRLLPVSAT